MSSKNEPRYACVTDYATLYSANYYGHHRESFSFDPTVFPPQLMALSDLLNVSSILDVGGGSGELSEIWRATGRKAFSLDVHDSGRGDSECYDLSTYAPDQVDKLKKQFQAVLGNEWLTTCLDVAEHIDIEHVSGFLLTLRQLTHRFLVLSVSTRPSSMSNRFHASVLPVETWIALLNMVGLRPKDTTYFDRLLRYSSWSGASEKLVAVSHWRKINPFRDAKEHQHYLLLEKVQRDPAADLTSQVAALLDYKYRLTKRVEASPSDLPHCTYALNFVQDWSFARSLMDVWPADRVRLLIRRDCVSEIYCNLLCNSLIRRGIAFEQCGTSAEMSPEGVNEERQLYVTATEGLPFIPHTLASLAVLRAREAGYLTLCMQHGMTLPTELFPASEYMCAWDVDSYQKFTAMFSCVAETRAVLLGSVKFLDALLDQQADAFSSRFGSWVTGFRSRYLVGLNLHWDAHLHKSPQTYDWLRRLITANPQSLFVIRPHPDDGSIYEQSDILAAGNTLLIDDIILFVLDWSIARLVRAMTGVITTYSTLMIDAIAANVPVALLPVAQEYLSRPEPAFGPAHPGELRFITDDEWASGAIPKSLMWQDEPSFPDWFNPSRSFFANLRNIITSPSYGGSITPVVNRIQRNLLKVMERLALDTHPQGAMKFCERRLTEFVS